MNARRRRGLLLLCVALASGGLAASEVHQREQRAAERLGPEVQVLVAARDLRAGSRIGSGAVGSAARTHPLRSTRRAALGRFDHRGPRGSPVRAGAYLTASVFEGQARPENGVMRRGERAVMVEVAGGATVAGLQPGARVDVLVSTETGAGGGRTTMALAGAELLGVEAGGSGETAAAPDDVTAAGPTALATLRVSVEQAIYLTAADNFAREIRLMPRPNGDHTRAGGTVSQGQL